MLGRDSKVLFRCWYDRIVHLVKLVANPEHGGGIGATSPSHHVSEEGWQWYLVTCPPFVGGGDSEKCCGALVAMVATLIWYLKSRKGFSSRLAAVFRFTLKFM